MCRDRVTRGVRMQLLRVTALAVSICVLAPPPPASAQISPNAAWSCEFANSATACGFYLQAAASHRAAVVGPGRDGSTAIALTTHLGDINTAGSDSNGRADLALSPSSRYCNQGQDEWWAHSLMFPPSYVAPPAGAVWNWGALFDFHNSSPGGGQPNFMVYATPTGLELHMAGGANTVNLPSDPGYYSIAIGPITKNVWYDFVYHVKWSSGSDGLFQAWLNGKQVMNYSGPNLYVGQSCYLKIANYHTEPGCRHERGECFGRQPRRLERSARSHSSRGAECGWPDTSGGHERPQRCGPHRRYGHAAVEHYGGLRQRDQREPGRRHERGECFGRQPRRLERSDASTTTAAAACRDEGPRLRLQRQWQVRHPVA